MDEMAGQERVDTRRFPSSWRLTFHYDENGAVVLAGREDLPMVAPGSPEPVSSRGEYSGTWVELQDSQGRVLFERVLHDPFRAKVELRYPSGRRTEAGYGPREPGEFEVLLPAMPDAAAVVVWSSELDAGRRDEAAREVARFSLGEGTHDGVPG